MKADLKHVVRGIPRLEYEGVGRVRLGYRRVRRRNALERIEKRCFG